MDNNYKEDIINIIDTLKELIIKELNTDLSLFVAEFFLPPSFLWLLARKRQSLVRQGFVSRQNRVRADR